MLIKDSKELKNAIFVFSFYMGPLIKCPKWPVLLAKRNSILPAYTNGFQLAKIPHVHFVGICSEDQIDCD